MGQLCKLVSSEECVLKSLDVSDSKLKEATWLLLDSLTRNTSIVKLDIRSGRREREREREIRGTWKRETWSGVNA